MGAMTAYGQSSSAIDLGADAVGDDIDRALTLPRAFIEANLRAGSALLEFAGGLSVEIPRAEYEKQKHNKEWVVEFPPTALRAL